ncbi:hypothetical protein JKP88DRAFT_262795 [Tribonema minus]|uniref:Uncharacterized protein n=1 Tax=Tribonema minus TaxID=303371 RepID=A0A835YZD5_9STRA|nr:hypothetical protein JKP88DRAFT_262795 [Tribonema minus]
MAEARDSAGSGVDPATPQHVLAAEIADTRRSLLKVERSIESIYAARRDHRVLDDYKSKEEQDQTLHELKEKKALLLGILGTLISQRAQAQTQQARIPDCIQFKGIRAMLYLEAEKAYAYCTDGTHDQAIKYVCWGREHAPRDLALRLGFKQEQHALGFRLLLVLMGRGQLLRRLKDRVADIVLDHIPAARLGNLVSASEFVAAAADSLAGPRGDALNIGTSTSQSTSSVRHQLEVALDGDLALYQSIEDPEVFAFAGVEGARIWPGKRRRGKFEVEGVNLNNLLGLSPSMRSAFHGPHGAPPTIAIRPASTPLHVAPPDQVVGRHVVEVAIECCDLHFAKHVEASLKAGSHRVETDSGVEYDTWVHVRDPKAFSEYLERYYEMTKKQWD